jgi:hypothetical protein
MIAAALLLALGIYADSTVPLSVASKIPFSDFTMSCERRPAEPFSRFWGHRPSAGVIRKNDLFAANDPNFAILPKWVVPSGNNYTIPFTDTHVAVRFLGGVKNFTEATNPGCDDSTPEKSSGPNGQWCDLVVRQPDGSLKTRYDLVHGRLDKFVHNGFDLMIVLDNVPWAFVNKTTSGTCKYGCQYKPPDNPLEFAQWVGTLAAYLVKAYGRDYASRIQWRLATEANGPRWSNNGQFYQNYWETYSHTAKIIQAVIPGARVGASNWVEQGKGEAGTNPNSLAPNGSDSFQFKFYSDVAKDPVHIDHGLLIHVY